MIGLITLGHSPRPDHEEVYERIAPGVPRTLVGALDGLSCAEARSLEDKLGDSPLVSLLSDKTTVEIPLPTLFPFIERQVDALASKGARLAVVLCCGGFPMINAPIKVLLPGMIMPAMIKAICPGGKIGIIVPNEAQEAAAVEHWQEQGMTVASAVVSPYEDTGFTEAGEKFRSLPADLVAIDCMGFREEHRQRLRDLCGCPVLLPTTLAARVALEIYRAAN
jgi:protein AroM